MTREEAIQHAIEEWAAIAGGPKGPSAQPTLARYIESVISEHESPLRADAMNVLTVYDAATPPVNRGPWRDRLRAWAGTA